jgi:hypothetical protein
LASWSSYPCPVRRIERQEGALGADRRSVGHRAHARVFSLGAGEYACQARVEVRDSPASHGAPRARPLPRLQHAHCIARISGPRANFAAGQLPTFLPGPGAHNAGRSARVIFFILNSTLGTLGPCCAARQAAMASSLLDPERRMPTARALASHTSSQRSVQRRRIVSVPRPLPDSALRGAIFDKLDLKKAGPLVKTGRANLPSTCLD